MDPQAQPRTTFGAIVEKTAEQKPTSEENYPFLSHVQAASNYRNAKQQESSAHQPDLEAGLHWLQQRDGSAHHYINPPMLSTYTATATTTTTTSPLTTPIRPTSVSQFLSSEAFQEETVIGSSTSNDHPIDEDSISNAPTISNNQHNSHTMPSLVVPTTPISTSPSPTAPPSTNEKLPLTATTTATGVCSTRSMWPTQAETKAKAKASKLARSQCLCCARMSKKTRATIALVVIFTVIGGAIGIGLGVSRAYGGRVWAGNGKTVPIAS